MNSCTCPPSGPLENRPPFEPGKTMVIHARKHVGDWVWWARLLICVRACRDMTEKRMPHLRWRERRPPMLAFESFALLQKE